MFTNELKCIEALMRHVILQTSLQKEVSSIFESPLDFEIARGNLFNIISINNLLSSFTENPSFSLEYFLNTGSIQNLYPERVPAPKVDPKFQKNYQGFYRALLKALKEGNYIFDEENNVFVSSKEIECLVPQLWLYRLSSAFKRNTYKEMFMYNKKVENNIYDENSLLDYIRFTKTFLVTLTSSNPNINYHAVYKEMANGTRDSIKDKREVRVSNLIETFKSLAPNDCEVNISKYKLSDALWLIMKSKMMGQDFYNQPLEVQQRFINEWLLDYVNSNDLANKQTQKYLIVTNLNPKSFYYDEDISKKSVLIGLFNLYISIINSLNLDLSSISLTDFRLGNYASPEFQSSLIRLQELIKTINRQQEEILEAKQEAESLLERLKSIDESKEPEKYERYKAKYEKALEVFRSKDARESEYETTRNQLQAIVGEEKKNSLAEIAFDNEKIMSLILAATKNGRIYISQNNKTMHIELYNDELGRNVFKASIPLEKLLEFITNVNLSFSDYGHAKRAS